MEELTDYQLTQIHDILDVWADGDLTNEEATLAIDEVIDNGQ